MKVLTEKWWSEDSKLGLLNTKGKYFPKLHEWRKKLRRSASKDGTGPHPTSSKPSAGHGGTHHLLWN